MGKYLGKIGFEQIKETSPGIWESQFIERDCYMDVTQRRHSFRDSNESINDDLSLSCDFSILADPYIRDNFYSIRYLIYKNVKWKVTGVSDQGRPRISLEIGGIFNG